MPGIYLFTNNCIGGISPVCSFGSLESVKGLQLSGEDDDKLWLILANFSSWHSSRLPTHPSHIRQCVCAPGAPGTLLRGARRAERTLFSCPPSIKICSNVTSGCCLWLQSCRHRQLWFLRLFLVIVTFPLRSNWLPRDLIGYRLFFPPVYFVSNPIWGPRH